MPLPNLKNYTIADIYALPDGERAELVNGQLYLMAPPTATHQRIVHFLGWKIESYIRERNGECEVFPAPFAVFLKDDESNYFEPDISVICDRDKIDDKGCHGAPDWVIEVVSPSSRAMDYYTKLAEYKAAGVREYWIVDPSRKRVMAYDLEHEDAPVIYTLGNSVKARIYDDLEIDFSELHV